MDKSKPKLIYLKHHSMKKPILMMLGFLVVCLTCMFLLFQAAGKEIQSKLDEPKVNVGKRYVFNKDTVQVVDYSTLKQTYTFDNGREVAFELVSSLKEVK